MFAQAHHPEVPEAVTLFRAAEGKLPSHSWGNGVALRAKVTVRGLTSKPHLNGSAVCPTCRGRFNVLLADGASTLRWPANPSPGRIRI